MLARSSETLIDLNIDGDENETDDGSLKDLSGTELSWLFSVDLYEMLDASG